MHDDFAYAKETSDKKQIDTSDEMILFRMFTRAIYTVRHINVSRERQYQFTYSSPFIIYFRY